jgi:hypothetical protein
VPRLGDYLGIDMLFGRRNVGHQMSEDTYGALGRCGDVGLGCCDDDGIRCYGSTW